MTIDIALHQHAEPQVHLKEKRQRLLSCVRGCVPSLSDLVLSGVTAYQIDRIKKAPYIPVGGRVYPCRGVALLFHLFVLCLSSLSIVALFVRISWLLGSFCGASLLRSLVHCLRRLLPGFVQRFYGLVNSS